MKQFRLYSLSLFWVVFVYSAFILFFYGWRNPTIHQPNHRENHHYGFYRKVAIRSRDEIGQLSQNINYLSDQMETYIGQLQQDLIKKES